MIVLSIMNRLRIRISRCSICRSKHLWHHLKCVWYCVSENLHILLQSFRGFVKIIFLFLHARKYSLTEVKVWFMWRFFALINFNFFGQFFITSICQHFFHLLSWWLNLLVILIRHVVTVDWWFLNWRRCIGRNTKILHMIICNCIFKQFILSYSIFINLMLLAPFSYVLIPELIVSVAGDPLHISVHLSWKNATSLPPPIFFLTSSAFL